MKPQPPRANKQATSPSKATQPASELQTLCTNLPACLPVCPPTCTLAANELPSTNKEISPRECKQGKVRASQVQVQTEPPSNQFIFRYPWVVCLFGCLSGVSVREQSLCIKYQAAHSLPGSAFGC
jgi:hypothetical protein